MSINDENFEQDEPNQESAAPLLTDTNPNKIYTSQGLIISGEQLTVIFHSEALTRIFAEFVPLLASVVVYRCSPSQKAQLVKFIQTQPNL